MEPQQYYRIPPDVFERDGPFEEFKKDGAIVTVELEDGSSFSGVVVLYPNYIISIERFDYLPFSPEQIVKVKQTESDLGKRTKSDWVWLPHPWDGESNGTT